MARRVFSTAEVEVSPPTYRWTPPHIVPSNHLISRESPDIQDVESATLWWMSHLFRGVSDRVAPIRCISALLDGGH